MRAPRVSAPAGTPPKPAPRSVMGRFDDALQVLVDTAKDGHDTSRQQKAMLERVRRMLNAARKRKAA